MTASITPSTDSKYVDVFVPIAFKKFGGRKTIVAPDGSQFLPGRSKATDSTLIKALSRAWRWQQLLDAGATAASRRWPTRKASTDLTSRGPSAWPCWRPTSSRPS
jgi:hypothetical protein